MQYRVISVGAAAGFDAATGLIIDIPKAAAELSRLVNQAIQEGWHPIGGVSATEVKESSEPHLLQAMVRK